MKRQEVRKSQSPTLFIKVKYALFLPHILTLTARRTRGNMDVLLCTIFMQSKDYMLRRDYMMFSTLMLSKRRYFLPV